MKSYSARQRVMILHEVLNSTHLLEQLPSEALEGRASEQPAQRHPPRWCSHPKASSCPGGSPSNLLLRQEKGCSNLFRPPQESSASNAIQGGRIDAATIARANLAFGRAEMEGMRAASKGGTICAPRREGLSTSVQLQSPRSLPILRNRFVQVHGGDCMTTSCPRIGVVAQ